MRTMKASEFKAKCLAELDRVDRTGESIVILKRGRPVARVVRETSEVKSPANMFKCAVEIVGDIVSPVVPADGWNAVRGVLVTRPARRRVNKRRGPDGQGKSFPG